MVDAVVTSESGPRFLRYFGPVLQALHQLGGSGRPAEVRPAVALICQLPKEVLEERLKSGGLRFSNDVNFVRFYLAKAGYIDGSQPGVWTLTEKGVATPNMPHATAYGVYRQVDSHFARLSPKGVSGDAAVDEGETAPEQLEDAASLHWQRALLEMLQSLPPGGFERLCQRLLRELGFEQVTVTGRSGDGGIDGIGLLVVNRLVSFKVLFQCKRYQGSVRVSEVRDFRGAMAGRADKGIFLTTGTFTEDARKEAVRDGVPPIELVEGERLVEMFAELKLGLKERVVYELDRGFFEPFCV